MNDVQKDNFVAHIITEMSIPYGSSQLQNVWDKVNDVCYKISDLIIHLSDSHRNEIFNQILVLLCYCHDEAILEISKNVQNYCLYLIKTIISKLTNGQVQSVYELCLELCSQKINTDLLIKLLLGFAALTPYLSIPQQKEVTTLLLGKLDSTENKKTRFDIIRAILKNCQTEIINEKYLSNLCKEFVQYLPTQLAQFEYIRNFFLNEYVNLLIKHWYKLDEITRKEIFEIITNQIQYMPIDLYELVAAQIGSMDTKFELSNRL